MARKKLDLWVIDFSSPDPSSASIEAYESREKAVDHAVRWIEYTAKHELEECDEGAEPQSLLREALAAAKAGRKDDAVMAWLEFQAEYDPLEKIALGPSGQVSPNPHDFMRDAP